MSETRTIDDRLYDHAGREATAREQELKRNPWFTCTRCGARFHYRDHHWCGGGS